MPSAGIGAHVAGAAELGDPLPHAFDSGSGSPRTGRAPVIEHLAVQAVMVATQPDDG